MKLKNQSPENHENLFALGITYSKLHNNPCINEVLGFQSSLLTSMENLYRDQRDTVFKACTFKTIYYLNNKHCQEIIRAL